MNEDLFAECNLQFSQNRPVAVCIKKKVFLALLFLSIQRKRRNCFQFYVRHIVCLEHVHRRSIFMSERKVEIHHSTAMTVPVEFGADLALGFEIKVQPNIPMNTTTVVSEKPLIPGLFQIAAYADDARSVSALKNALASNRLPLNEMTLDAERLEAILRNIADKKKALARRDPTRRFEKSSV
jgi:hypothetical protein